MSRNSRAGYIDQSENDVAVQAVQVDAEVSYQFDDAQSSGSSMEEESDEGVPFDDVSDDQSDQNIGGLEDGDFDEEPGDWDVDDEDWELANGDFTKQYNRVRQQHAATTGTAPLPARNAPSQPSSSKTSKPNPLASVGVAMNPKVAHEKQDKDKSDRATQDQVLDSRTRLVLAGLVNRNVIGKIERCVSTGKEVPAELRSASPRLKDAEVEADRLDALYAELVIAARRMYQHCHLVHADLSEYNILLHEGHLWIIDVSQSVEHDHPKAFDFLRADLQNVEDFFERRGVKCLGLRRAWEFVVTENLGLSPEEELNTGGDDKLTGIVTEWLSQPSNKTDDAVFMSSYIPRTLAEVYDPERDVDLLKRGGGDDLIYAGITGLKLAEKTEPKEVKEVRFEDAAGEEEDAESDAQTEDEPHKPRGFRHEDKDAKKERKKALKEENREKRKNKMPKAEKQRLIKKSQK